MAENLKVKALSEEQLITAIKRLTRFKDTRQKYFRVFFDIITHNLTYPQYKKSELEVMDYKKLRVLVQGIINHSLKVQNLWCENDFVINQKLFDYEKSICDFPVEFEEILDNKINYRAFLKLIDDSSSENLRWLKALGENTDIIALRNQEGFRYPIEAVVLVEGATEETLLPELAKISGYDFAKEGIYLLAAGGKNQVVRIYYELIQSLKRPIYVLLDADGTESAKEIEHKLRKTDRIHLIKSGEFEDLLPFDLIKRTLEYNFENISTYEEEMFKNTSPRVRFLEEIFKNRGMHEYKKADFARSVRGNIKPNEALTPEILEIVDEIKLLKQNLKEFIK